MLVPPSEAAIARLRAASTQGIQELGWREGKNIEYRFAYADGEVDRSDPPASDLVGQNVEAVVVAAPPATRAAQRATKTLRL